MNNCFNLRSIGASRILTALFVAGFSGLLMAAASPVFSPFYERETTVFPALDSIPLGPTSLKITVLSDFNGFNVSCHDSHDGSAKIEATNAFLPLEIYWSNGEISPLPTQLPGGWNGVSVTDAMGFHVIDSVFLTAPGSLQTELISTGEKCRNSADGSIQIKSATGGVTPFLFSLNDGPAIQNLEFSPLAAGQYFLKMEDANGCQDTFGLVVPAGLPFDFEIGIDSASIPSADSLRLPLTISGAVDTIIWSPPVVFSGLEKAIFSPPKTTFFIATAVDSAGCETTDGFILTVKKRRDYFFPNVLSVAAVVDENRFFTLFMSDGVVEIESLEVFDRWGNAVFSRKNFPAGQPELGWNGFFQGKPVAPGVFTWQAIIRQTDGQAKLYSATLTVFD